MFRMRKLSSQKLMSLWFIFNRKVYFVSMWKFQDFYMAMMFSGGFNPCVFGVELELVSQLLCLFPSNITSDGCAGINHINSLPKG